MLQIKLENIFGEGWPQHDSTSYLYLGVSQNNIFQKKELWECLSAESQEKNVHTPEGEIKIDDFVIFVWENICLN